MAQRDYYEILGVQRGADAKAIKQAYRRLAMKHHPDRNPDDEQAEGRFKEIQAAYETLSDEQKRAAYDRFGHAGVQGAAGAAHDFGGNFNDVFGDVFANIFGGGAGMHRRSGVRPGEDLRYEVEIGLEEAVRGTTIELSIPNLVSCTTCSGSGSRPGTHPVECSTCHGSGQVRMQQGFFSIHQTCPRCRGEGRAIESPCADCDGRGRVRKTRTLSVKLPAGVDDGESVRLAGAGAAGQRNAPAGDLYIQVRVRPHPVFVREGTDLHCEVPVSITTAALGGEIEVPTLEGRSMLQIRAGTQSGRIYRMRGKGVASLRGQRHGDLHCHVKVETPVNLTARQRELLQQLDREIMGKRHSPIHFGWLDRVKHFFNDVRR